MRFDAPVHLALHPSPRLRHSLVAAHGLLLLLLAYEFPLRVASCSMIAAILASLVLGLRALRRGGPCAIDALLLQTNGQWVVQTAGQGPVRADLLPGAFVTPSLTVLRFRLPDGRRRTALILPDNSDADTFRRLRVRLRTPRLAQPSALQP